MSVLLVDHDRLSVLVDAAREGDVDAFGSIYDLHHDRIYRMLLRLTRSHSLAEDLTSETFFRAMRSIRTSEVRGDYVTAWLIRIARNLAVDHFRAKESRYELSVDPFEQLATNGDVADGPEVAVLASISYGELMRAVDELPTNQRLCVTARFVDDLTIAETAALMGCTQGAVKQLQLRGVRNLALRMRAAVA